MKVKEVKELLAQYSDDDELMIAWNDSDILSYISESPNDKAWSRAVTIYEDSSLEGFGDDCRWAIREALDEVADNE